MYIVCVILFCCIIVNTPGAGLDPRSVNLNLETVLQFDPNDNSADVKFIDNLQQILGKVKTVIDNKSSRRSHSRPEAIKFTDFIRNTIDILRTYSDDDLEDVVSVLDNEIRKYHYKGCKFHELVQNGELRRYVAKQLSTVQNLDGKYIKKGLNNILDALDDAKYDYMYAQFLDYINSLYRQNDAGKMKSFLNQIKAYKVKSKRANLDLIRIIRNGMRSLIFDHYSKLNPNARKELRIKIESFWHRDKEVTTETTTKKKFDIANGFNFLRDFTFEFVKPETYTTKTTEYTTKPVESSQSNETKIDMTRQKVNKSPEVMPNYSDSEEIKEKTTTTEKSKQKEKKKDKHKKKKEHKRKRTHVTAADENLAPKRKHKSKKHKKEPVFRQHDARPMNVFDYSAVINVRGQTDESDSNEVWKPNENISSDRDKLKSKKFRSRDYRKTNVKDSEEGLSIDFIPSPKHTNTELTTKQDDILLRRLNDLEKVDDTFKSGIDNDESKETNVREKLTTVRVTYINKSPAVKWPSPEALKYGENTATIPTWQKLSQQVKDLESANKIRKPFVQDSIQKAIGNFENKQPEKTTEEISTTTENVLYKKLHFNESANIGNEMYFKTNINESNEVIQHDNDATNTTSRISEENEIENRSNLNKFLGKYNLSNDMLNDFKKNYDNITVMNTNDIRTTYREDDDDLKKVSENNNKKVGIDNEKNTGGTNEEMTDIGNENDIKIDRVRRKMHQDMQKFLAQQNAINNFGNETAISSD